MKLFKQLLVAPAALGLLAPVAAGATEVNVAGVADYASSSSGSSLEQVTSITQFSDVYPTDWAYQALSNLIERYGCVAGYPNGTYRGNRAMTRFEAAALLNACLDRVTEVTDELKRLMKEFEKELAILKGRVDGLEARVGELEATQFSTTTKLRGKVDFVMGGVSYTGEDYDLGEGKDYRGEDAVTFNYRTTLNLNTSFTGKDLLYTRLRAGNFGEGAFSGKGYTGNQTQLDVAKETGNTLKVDKLWYQFPVGDDLQVFVGPLIENYYMLGAAPSVYRQILKQFKLGGYYGVYGASTAPGAGVVWKPNSNVNPFDPKFSISLNYTAKGGASSDPQKGGIGTDASRGKFLAQVAYGGPQWSLSAAYAYIQNGATVGYGTPLGASTTVVGGSDSSFSRGFKDANAVALRAWWQPQESGWIPSISAGWGLTSFNSNDYDLTEFEISPKETSQDWMVGLGWKDAFIKGNLLGFAIGQPQFETARDSGTPDDGNYAMELFYQFQVTDNISVTPAAFYVSRPFGELTGTNDSYGGKGAESFGTFGYLVKTSFKF
ncbi:iron uptake porin [Synechococcus sp. NOUM97013]|uniref:iron uptake porin n=1 Tax=Synechococcus sp. NOUM97013 TaxID=1442555 RepID=UPI001646EBB9|nr:iron uptake porin [Synechococcus sp. NOUM97013]QNI73242.1 outer membrane porin [Synechococcus sp. NOUM97013]